MYEFVEHVYPVPSGFDPAQLGLGNAEPSTHDFLRKRLVPMRWVVSVRPYNRRHVTRSERVSHLVRVPGVRPEAGGMVGPNPAQLATWCAHAGTAVTGQATTAPHAVPSSGSHAQPPPRPPP